MKSLTNNILTYLVIAAIIYFFIKCIIGFYNAGLRIENI